MHEAAQVALDLVHLLVGPSLHLDDNFLQVRKRLPHLLHVRGAPLDRLEDTPGPLVHEPPELGPVLDAHDRERRVKGRPNIAHGVASRYQLPRQRLLELPELEASLRHAGDSLPHARRDIHELHGDVVALGLLCLQVEQGTLCFVSLCLLAICH